MGGRPPLFSGRHSGFHSSGSVSPHGLSFQQGVANTEALPAAVKNLKEHISAKGRLRAAVRTVMLSNSLRPSVQGGVKSGTQLAVASSAQGTG